MSSNLAVIGQEKLALVQSPMAGNLKIQTMDDLSRLCKMLADSKYFADATSSAQAGVKVLYGAEIGFPPITSMRGIHIIKGNPTVGANLIAAKIKACKPRYNYRIAQENGKALHTDKLCKLEAYEDGVLVGAETFTAEDAVRCGTQNMGKYPKNMLFARCISNLHRFYFPDLFGGMPVYTPEEFGGIVDDQDNLLNPDVISVSSEEVNQFPVENFDPMQKLGELCDRLKIPKESRKDLAAKAIATYSLNKVAKELTEQECKQVCIAITTLWQQKQNDAFISDEDSDSLWAIANERGVTRGKVLEIIAEIQGKAVSEVSSKEIKQSEYEAIVAQVEAV